MATEKEKQLTLELRTLQNDLEMVNVVKSALVSDMCRHLENQPDEGQTSHTGGVDEEDTEHNYFAKLLCFMSLYDSRSLP